jgi:hypothetical protein
MVNYLANELFSFLCVYFFTNMILVSHSDSQYNTDVSFVYYGYEQSMGREEADVTYITVMSRH